MIVVVVDVVVCCDPRRRCRQARKRTSCSHRFVEDAFVEKKPKEKKSEVKKPAKKQKKKAEKKKTVKAAPKKEKKEEKVSIVPVFEAPLAIPVLDEKKIDVVHTIRRNALEIKKAEEQEEKKKIEQEKEWEIPAFLRRVKFNK